MISACLWFSMRIHSSLTLDVSTDSLEGRQSTACSWILNVPFHLQLGNNSAGARLAGAANPLHQEGFASFLRQTKHSHPCPAAESLEMTAGFAQVTTWAIITFSVSSPLSGAGWEVHENAWGKEAHLNHISDHQDKLPGGCLWVLGYCIMICNIPKYSIKEDPKLRQCPTAPALMVETDFPHLLASHPNPHLFNKQ